MPSKKPKTRKTEQRQQTKKETEQLLLRPPIELIDWLSEMAVELGVKTRQQAAISLLQQTRKNRESAAA
jgi:hypothetical protein